MFFRYARHTNQLEKLISFYTQVLNFDILGEFRGHTDYDGVFLGLKDQNWHLEFTQNNEAPSSAFDEDDALVFYSKTQDQHNTILTNLKNHGINLCTPKNPYWKVYGICFEDPDGMKVILSSQKI